MQNLTIDQIFQQNENQRKTIKKLEGQLGYEKSKRKNGDQKNKLKIENETMKEELDHIGGSIQKIDLKQSRDDWDISRSVKI